ncbi:S-layer homology domain-containing protein [Trichocoleus desertorum AS-A10]|uniref:S-layer homology domain-containing protein n=1 Tax=Trichocoleus desertorum TaxID=1481672 RepID=UPI0032992CA6
MHRLLSAISLVVLLQGLQLVVQAQSVPETPPLGEPVEVIAPVADPIAAVVAAGLMTKDSNGDFRETDLLSRAELASILVKTFQLNQRAAAKQGEPVPVDDVSPNYWGYKDIQTVLKTKTMTGYRGRLFYPNQKITRAEALAIFAQAYGVYQFPDATVEAILARYPDSQNIPAWARKAMATALNEGFVNVERNRISPLQPITRGDLAYALSQYLARQTRPDSTPAQETPTPQ